MTDRYYSYSPTLGHSTHRTAAAARAEAEAALDLYRDCAEDGWNSDVEEVCWGEIRQAVRKGTETPAEPGSHLDYICDYDLADVAEEAPRA